jgi:hypothetical protein
MMRVFGSTFRISRAASKPLLSGNPKSNSTKSGLNFLTIRIASQRFSASPITSKTSYDKEHKKIDGHLLNTRPKKKQIFGQELIARLRFGKPAD